MLGIQRLVCRYSDALLHAVPCFSAMLGNRRTATRKRQRAPPAPPKPRPSELHAVAPAALSGEIFVCGQCLGFWEGRRCMEYASAQLHSCPGSDARKLFVQARLAAAASGGGGGCPRKRARARVGSA